MTTVLIISYTIVCLFLVLTVLLQSGKGGGMGAIGGGGGGSGSVFGGRGASTFMSKLTAVMAGLFMIISVCLTLVDVSPVQAAADATQGDETEQPAEGDQAPADDATEASDNATDTAGEGTKADSDKVKSDAPAKAPAPAEKPDDSLKKTDEASKTDEPVKKVDEPAPVGTTDGAAEKMEGSSPSPSLAPVEKPAPTPVETPNLAPGD